MSPVSASILLAAVYFILVYENAPERQAFIGANLQAIGNQLELTRVVLFAILIWVLLPYMKNMSAIWIAMICGVIFQRLVMSYYWSTKVNDIGWSSIKPKMKPVFKRLAGKQAGGYVGFGDSCIGIAGRHY